MKAFFETKYTWWRSMPYHFIIFLFINQLCMKHPAYKERKYVGPSLRKNPLVILNEDRKFWVYVDDLRDMKFAANFHNKWLTTPNIIPKINGLIFIHKQRRRALEQVELNFYALENRGDPELFNVHHVIT